MAALPQNAASILSVSYNPKPSMQGEVFSHAAFTYDGDGKCVKSVLTTNVGTTTTYFVGTHYEVTSGVVTKYYYAGAQRIAMRKAGELFYILGDHLGSTSLVINANGTKVSEMRYKAWGEVRYESGVTPTNHTYTGQYSNVSDFGLMYYRARWMDPQLGRFSQPDTIIPSTQGVQAWDRFAYTNNNPVRYTDPTGHSCVPCLVAVLVIGAIILSGDTPKSGSEVSNSSLIDLDKLIPSAGISSLSVSESLAFTNENYMEPSLISVDLIDNNDVVEPFITVAQGSPTASCNGPCGSPYPHFMSPNAGISLTDGKIWGDTLKQDIFNYQGRAYNVNIGIGPVNFTGFTSVDSRTGEADFKVFGVDVSVGPSFAPISVSAFYSHTSSLKMLME